MWIVLLVVVSASVGACLGFVFAAMMTMAKGSREDQRHSDEEEIAYVREWHHDRNRARRGAA